MPIAIEDLMATPAFAESDFNKASYAAWLITTASGSTMKRFEAALSALGFHSAFGYRRDMVLCPNGIIMGIPERIPPMLIGYDTIDWLESKDCSGRVEFDAFYINGPFIPGREYQLAWQDWGTNQNLVWRLNAFVGGALIDSANRAWARIHLSQHVAFNPDGDVIVPALQPLHPDVGAALERLAHHAALDDDLYGDILSQAEIAEWEERGRDDFWRLLTNRIKNHLAEKPGITCDVDARTWTFAPVSELEKVLEEREIEDAVRVHVDAVFGNIQQYAGHPAWDEENGFIFDDIIRTLNKRLQKDDLTIAPILLALCLPVRIGDTAVNCAFCGQALHQSTNYCVWLDDSNNPLCPSRIGQSDPRHDPQL